MAATGRARFLGSTRGSCSLRVRAGGQNACSSHWDISLGAGVDLEARPSRRCPRPAKALSPKQAAVHRQPLQGTLRLPRRGSFPSASPLHLEGGIHLPFTQLPTGQQRTV